ncbi:hypothetical protein MNBD_GAMMA22-3035 [hydrothermal vent metagenome]|uniref:Uncharacterized protein n=1 Tax=hydrothermal vent metagenome TaxID=652676 RepID=A0A3B1ASM6_9ZZZZ
MNIKKFQLCCTVIIWLAILMGTPVYASEKYGLDKQLYFAARKGDFKKVKELVEQGADVNYMIGTFDTPLMTASIDGHHEIVKYLLDNGADSKIATKSGKTALHSASRGNVKIVQLLLDNGANADAHDKENLTPLSGAISMSNFKIMKLLIEHGAHVNDANQWGVTALMVAAESADINFVRHLLEKGAKVNTVEKGIRFISFNPRQTALRAAVKKHRPEVVKLLLDYGANAHIPDDQNRTPIDWAKRYQHTDILKIFKDYKVLKKLVIRK